MRILITSGALGAAVLAWSFSPGFRSDWRSVAMGPTRQLTNTPGLELDPAISPDGKLISYAGGIPGRTRIYVRPMAGGDAVQVSGELMRQHRWPSWSPDGSQLAFLASGSDRENAPGRLFVVNALGGARRVIADSLSFFSTPAWSPDGQFIAYPLLDSIVLWNTKGGPPSAVSARPRKRRSDAMTRGSSMWAIHSLAWSPDGRRLVFVSGNPAYAFANTAFGNLGPSSIWTVALDGSPPTRVTTGSFTFGSPVFTPDGRGILYVSNADGAWDVYYQALDGTGRPAGQPKRLTTGLNAHGISLSRDGSRLAYSLMNLRSNIFTAPITPGRVTPAAALRPVTDENQTVETVDVTRDGTWLVFESNREGRSHIYKLPAAGGELVQLTHETVEDFAPKWSPDGRWITFHTREPSKDGLRDVYVINADGTGRTRLSADAADDAYPSFASDSRHILFGQTLTSAMVSTLQPDGRWSVAERDSSRGTLTGDGGYNVFLRRGDLYAQREGGAPHLLVSGQRLGGPIVAARTAGVRSLVTYVRAIDSAGVHSFYSLPVAGGTPTRVLRLDNSPRQPSRILFSTDGRSLYFTVTQAESDIWVVALRR